MTQAGLPVDLILFAMIAAFLVLRLRSILGRRTGFEGEPASRGPGPRTGAPTLDARAEPAEASARPLPDPASALGATLAAMVKVDRKFDPAQFLAGAEKAFRMIVSAFAAGERETLRPLLTDDTFRAFESVIAAREAAGETQHTEIRDILEAAISDATLEGTRAGITVRFVSRQVNYTRGADGATVAGADAVTELVDVWDFTRDLGRGDPAWRLGSARSG